MEAWRDWDIPSMQLMFEHWAKHPPVPLMLASALKYGPKPEPAEVDQESGMTLFDLGKQSPRFDPLSGAHHG